MLFVLVAANILSWIMVISDIQQTGDKLQITDLIVCIFPYIYNWNF